MMISEPTNSVNTKTLDQFIFEGIDIDALTANDPSPPTRN